MGERSEPTGIGAERRLSLRGGTEPAPYQGNRSSAVYGGVRSPRPTEAPTGRCGHRPLRIEGEATSTTWGSGAERSVCGADGRNEEESEQRSPPKGPATPDNPSVSLRGTGDADCHVGPAGLLAMTMVFCHSEERSDVGIRPFYDGRGLGPPRSSAPTERPESFPYFEGATFGRPQAFPLQGGRCRAHARRMRVGFGMAEPSRRAGQCPAPTKEGMAYRVAVGAAPCGRPLFSAALLEFTTSIKIPVVKNEPIQAHVSKPSPCRAYYSRGEEHEQTQNQTVIPTNGGEPAPESPAAPVS